MHQPIIFIPVESKKREFDGKILLTARLLRHGFRVVLGTKAGVHREILFARSSIYLAKSASNVFLSFYKNLKSRDHHLVVLDVEGGALTREIKNDLLRSYQQDSAAYFDYFYVFGENIREAMTRELEYIRPEQVVVSGEPRFDFLRPEYDPFFREEMDGIRSRYGQFILINTSFGLSNSVLGDEGIRRFLSTTEDIPEEQRHLYMLKHEEGKFLLKEFVELAKSIAGEFPGVKVIIRPHPDEDPSVYHQSFDGHESIVVNGDGNVHPWIKSAAAVIHHDCTTGMESVMAGRPTISYVPRMKDAITAWLPVYLSRECQTRDEVIQTLGPILQKDHETYYPGDDKASVFREYFENYRSESSILLADHLENNYNHLASQQHSTPLLWMSRWRSVLNILRYKAANKHGWERFVYVDASEIRKKLILTGLFKGKAFPSIRLHGGNTASISLKHEQD